MTRYFRLVSKYALILAVFSFLEYLFRQYSRERTTDLGEYQLLRAMLPFLLTIGLNVVTAFLLAGDTKRLGVKTHYLVLSTVLYRPIGVCAFLLYAMYDQYKTQRTT